MSKDQQIQKNIDLSEKLADYIASNPDVVKGLPQNASYVTYSSNDDKLNVVNKNLIESLKKEGKQIIEAQETNNATTPWKFTTVTI